MARVQLAVNVRDLDRAIDFYSRLFGTRPAKVRPGYANFAVDDPPLKLVLIQGGEGGTLNHLGVEVTSSEDVLAATHRLRGQGLTATEETKTDCCYALQDKVWVQDPDGARWEVYAVLADSATSSPHSLVPVPRGGEGICCNLETSPQFSGTIGMRAGEGVSGWGRTSSTRS